MECVCAAGCLVYGVEGVCLNPNCKGPVRPEECDPPHYSPCFVDDTNKRSLGAQPGELSLTDDDDIPYGF
ncbi:MAG TPA: hypothetical protein PLF57_00050 [Candidatus Saccharibacteria bacterium]|nr:hypothetical protein [Candidatus Saccharibacteria bacterium]HPW47960.1 hypothetical protein [Candidatus Saccharibacteria bacterium]